MPDAQARWRQVARRALESFRWSLEELAVSLFAQELENAVPGLGQAAGKGVDGTLSLTIRPALALWRRLRLVLQSSNLLM